MWWILPFPAQISISSIVSGLLTSDLIYFISSQEIPSDILISKFASFEQTENQLGISISGCYPLVPGPSCMSVISQPNTMSLSQLEVSEAPLHSQRRYISPDIHLNWRTGLESYHIYFLGWWNWLCWPSFFGLVTNYGRCLYNISMCRNIIFK